MPETRKLLFLSETADRQKPPLKMPAAHKASQHQDAESV